MQAVEFALKPPAQHGLVNTFSTGGGTDKEHADHVGIGAIRVGIGARPKSSDLGRTQQPQVFLLDHKYVAVGHQQKVHNFIRNAQAVQRVAQSGK